MKLQVLKTTDGKNIGTVFEIDTFTHDGVNSTIGRDYYFEEVTMLPNNKIRMRSSHYTALLKIIEQ